MFNSSPLNSRADKSKVNSTLNSTTGDLLRVFGAKPSSTPCPRKDTAITTPTRSNNSLTRRYSLSDVNTTPVYPKDASRTPKSQTFSNSSQIMTNGRHNVNASTYWDSRSPGYASRIVRYNEEQERSLPTHNKRYNLPGVFPIVHLNKKELPILKRRPSTVTVKIASPDLSRYHTPEQNRMLLEKIVNSKKSASPKINDLNTKSVLDALKEISRKRIHTNEEEFEFQDDGKRFRLDCAEAVEGKKRLRDDDSPKAENSGSPKNLRKKQCSLGEVLASHTSMEGYLFEEPQKTTSKIIPSTRKRTPIKTEAKKIKLVDVETQTLAEEESEAKKLLELSSKNVLNGDLTKIAENETAPTPKLPLRVSPIKVFDEKPLEMMRKNRLSALMGSLSEPNRSPTAEIVETTKSSELISILSSSSSKSSDHSLNKHVSFNIPGNSEEVSSSSESSVSMVSTVSTPAATASSPPEVPDSPPKTNPNVTQTSAALVTPIVSSTVVESSFEHKSNAKIELKSPQPTFTFSPQTTPIVSTQNTEKKEIVKPVAPQFSFGVSAKLPSTENKSSEAVGITATSPASSGFSFGGNSAATPSSSSAGAMVTSPQPVMSATIASSNKPVGGFKFDLNQSVKTVAEPVKTAAPVMPTFSFGAAKSPEAPVPTNPPLFFSKPAEKSSAPASNPTFAFSTTSSTAAPPPNPFVMKSSTGGAPSFSFTPPKTTSTPSAATAISTSNAPNFSFMASPANSSAPTKTPSVFTLGNPAQQPAFGGALGGNPPAATSTGPVDANKSFGVPLTQPQTSKPPVFSFGASKAEPAPAQTPVFGAPDKPVFGNVTTATTTSSSSFFAAPTSKPSFGTPTTQAANMFNNIKSNSSFGNVFSAPSNTTATGNIFGSTTTTVSSNIFGATTTAAPTTNIFAATAPKNVAPFGNTTSNMFSAGNNNTQTPSFGAPNPTSTQFGAKSTPFGAPPTTTAAAVPFGASAATPFGVTTTTASSTMFGNPSSNKFGATTNTNNAFGAVTTAPSAGFTMSTPAFGASTGFASSGFGSGATATTTPAFGSFAPPAAPAFGATATPTFNQTNNAFGAPNTGFQNAAGAEANAAFGAKSSGFGGGAFAPPTTTQSQGGVFTFGTSAPSKPAVFSFGQNAAAATADAPKPAINFSGGSQQPPAAFGAAPPANFGASFGQPNQAAPATFTIGTGSATPNQKRPQMRAKRRTDLRF